MEFFRSIGAELAERWRRAGGTEASFPALAAAVLRERDPSANLSSAEVVGRLLAPEPMPQQIAVNIEHPFTLFRGERFSIHAYFWVDGSVDIHDHSFWGAFQVFSGSSLHTRYRYVEHEVIAPGLVRGELSLLESERLQRGDVREIVPGREFIHGLFHLDRPSITILVATERDPRYFPPVSYLRPGLAVDPFTARPNRDRRLKALSLVAAAWPENYEAEVARMVARGDLEEAFHGLAHALKTLDGDGFARVLHAAREAHGPLVDQWETVFEESRRQAYIIERRALVHDPDHRYFLAVVLNAPDRASILEMIAARFPGRAPVDLIMKWVSELSEIPAEGPAGPTAIGALLNDAELLILRALIQGGDEEDVLANLATQFDRAHVEQQREAVVELISAFRASLFFGHLVGASPTR